MKKENYETEVDLLRNYLLQAQQNGEYEGHPEHKMDFNHMPNKDLEYYFDWVDEETFSTWFPE